MLACLREFYPVALELFDDCTKPCAWSLITQFPTPTQLQAAGKRRWEKFLHTQHLWRSDTAPARLEHMAHVNALPASPAVVKAKTLLAATLVKVLQILEGQLDAYRRRITEAFRQHLPTTTCGSRPRAGEKLAPRLLGEVGSVREVYPEADALCCQAGVSPVSFQSGKLDKARIRWACDVMLRHTVPLGADCSRKQSAWAQADDPGKRKEGHDHASALRGLGKRWLKILWRLWPNRQRDDETHHQQPQHKHGSWVSGVLHAATPATV